MGFWVDASADGFTARCATELERMRRSEHANVTIPEVMRDNVGCPPPIKRVRPRQDSGDQNASDDRGSMGAVSHVSSDGLDVTVRTHMESGA